MKVEVQNYQKSLNKTNFTPAQIAMIWDFYVTKSIASSAAQKRKVSDYGMSQLPWKEMLETAKVSNDNCKVLLANSMNKTLEKYNLVTTRGSGNNKENVAIDIETPKIVCLSPFTISDGSLGVGSPPRTSGQTGMISFLT